MAFNINEIKSQLVYGGARPTLFQCQITNPIQGAADLKVPFMVRSTTMPASTLGTIEVPYFGRKIKVAGDRTFDTWSVTVINDEDFLIRNAMEEWSSAINTHLENQRATGSSQTADYKSRAQVTQYSKDGLALRTYSFEGIFPVEISDIGVDWDTTDSIEEFTVTFQYDWWNISSSRTGLGGTGTSVTAPDGTTGEA
jgi:hypothetical protein